MPPEVPLLYWLAIVSHLFSHLKLSIVFFEVCEEFCLDFDGDCIESTDCFW